MNEGDLYDHEIWDLFESMMDSGLIPSEGDSNYFWPAMVLRVERLLYERLNNGNVNIDWFNQEFYKELQNDLNEKMKEYGFEDLGSTISYKEPEKVWDMLTEFVEIVRQHEEE